MIRNYAWRALASAALAVGAIGVVLPGLPTVPFVLLAAWAGARGWPDLERRLLAHPHFGPLITDWRDNRAVPRRAKYGASALMTLSVVSLWIAPAPLWLRWVLTGLLAGVACWLWTRREPGTEER
ncbi:YbaN family protein [Halopseudomonas nanhaiensis]|uniref:YbaN family protein n=1 Tax=Halopseudomonas nanhaiensis TaxID=2830842 RepID=UPI001CBECB3B|nr:YbaN family protein [Halopseudomonas nanhaiensis]UAW99356.1 YbaN family protein [Halopseudomonas nanhaiensis]